MRCRANGELRLRWVAAALPAMLLTLAAATPAGATISYDVSVGVSENDNVRLTPSDQRSDTIATAGLDLTIHEQRRTFDADVTADLDYLDYLHHSYSSAVIGNFLGDARVSVVPEKLQWAFADNFGQGLINPLAAVTPDNRENINYFSTGPDLILPLGSMNALLLDGRYSNVNYQTSSLSSNRFSGGVGLRRELSSASAVSFNLQDEQIRFQDSSVNPDYSQQEAYFRYNAHGVRTRLDIQVGVSRLKRRNDDSPSEAMVRAELTRQLSSWTSLTVTLGHDFSDAGDSFRLQQALNGANLATQAGQPTADPFKNEYATLGWGYARQRTGFGFTMGHYKLIYLQNDSLDEQRTSADAHVSRRLTPTLEATILANYARDTFKNVVGNSRQMTGTAQLTWRASRDISVVMEYDHSRRESDIRSTGYVDNVAWMKLRYGRVAQAPTGTVVPQLPVLPRESGYQ